MVRQAHHERHCILSLSKDQSNDKGVCKFAVIPPALVHPLQIEPNISNCTMGLKVCLYFELCKLFRSIEDD